MCCIRICLLCLCLCVFFVRSFVRFFSGWHNFIKKPFISILILPVSDLICSLSFIVFFLLFSDLVLKSCFALSENGSEQEQQASLIKRLTISIVGFFT